MAEPNPEGLRSEHETNRGIDSCQHTSAADAGSAPKEGVVEPLDQIAPRSVPPPTPIAQFARTFRLSLRRSFNELLKPLQTLTPEHEVIPSWVGGGYDVLRCGHCDFAIAECVDIEQMRRQTLYCPRCTAENQVP